jgi:hypothetical protein
MGNPIRATVPPDAAGSIHAATAASIAMATTGPAKAAAVPPRGPFDLRIVVNASGVGGAAG